MTVTTDTYDEAIARFWAWWASNREAISSAIGDGTSTDWAELLSSQVSAIHERLDWEMGRGQVSKHALCMSGMGDPELRLVAERWAELAPDRDDTWEYHATRIAVADPTCVILDFGDVRVPFADLRVGLQEDEARECLHVQVFHPAFGQLPEQVRRQVAFLVLDNTLGEDGVERWLGAIELVDEEPQGAVDLPGLRDAVTRLAEEATGEVYARLVGETEAGEPVEVIANLSLKRWDHPTYDAHGQIVVPYEPVEDGMPSDEEARAMDLLEAGLVSALGGNAVFAGREQGLGRRLVHLYAAEHGPVPDAITRWVEQAPRPVSVSWSRDPAWLTWRRW